MGKRTRIRENSIDSGNVTKTSFFFKLLMGIRFYCPKGHKLNVKEHLAGKRGICPHCGMTLMIPQKSTRPSSREEQSAGAVGGNLNEFDVFADDPATDSGGHTVSAQPSGATEQDAAFDDPNDVWYVQLPDGQRFGPATLPIIQTWIKEHRISPTMLVIRDGWEDWLEAGQVFPETVQIFQKTPSKKAKNELITENQRPDDLRMDTGDEIHKTSAIMIVMVVLFILIFGVVLYTILKP